MSNHLSSQQMLAYVDGELSRSETRQAEEHLHSCWTCLAALERLKDDIAAILDAQNESFTPALPPPPRPWPGFDTILARSLPAEPASLWVRFGGRLRPYSSPVRVLVLSGIVAVLAIGVYSIFRARAVSAQEVLRRVRAVDTRRSAITKNQVIRERVQIREVTHGQSHAKSAHIDTWKSTTAAYWNVGVGDSVAVDLKAQYQAHDIPVVLPLSAESVDPWGMATGGKPTISQQGSDLALSFNRPNNGTAGAVERVSLVIESQSWHVRQMTLDFPEASFEVMEDDYSVVPTSEVPADLLAYLEPGPLTPPATRPVLEIAASAIHLPIVNLDQVELDVFATLHSLKADLGEPVIVTRSSQTIQVWLWELPADRQTELRAALVGKAGVQLELTAPPVLPNHGNVASPTVSPSTTNGTPLYIGAESGEEDQRVVKFFGGSEREQDFTNEALETSTVVLSHLYALRNLQEQFPVEKSQSLAPDEQAQLLSLIQDHVTAIAANVDALERQFAPLDASFNVPRCTSMVLPKASWQRESLEALDTARVIDHLLRALLTVNQAPAVPDSALPQINQNLCRLREELGDLSAMSIH